MKKFIAVFLAVLCIFSVFAVSVSADDVLSELSEELGGDESVYGITYQNQTLSQVKMMYKPTPTISLSGPGYVTVTKDTPIAIDHNFVAWKDSDGNLYFEGDKVYVDGTITLYAVWEEKTDNNSHVIRVIQCAFATLQRLVQKFLGVFEDVQEFDSSYYESLSQSSIQESIAADESTSTTETTTTEVISA